MRRSLFSRVSAFIAALLVATSASGSALAHGVAHAEEARHADAHHAPSHQVPSHHAPSHHAPSHYAGMDGVAEIHDADHPAEHGHQTLGPVTKARTDAPALVAAASSASFIETVVTRNEPRPAATLAAREGIARGSPRQPRAPPLR